MHSCLAINLNYMSRAYSDYPPDFFKPPTRPRKPMLFGLTFILCVYNIGSEFLKIFNRILQT